MASAVARLTVGPPEAAAAGAGPCKVVLVEVAVAFEGTSPTGCGLRRGAIIFVTLGRTIWLAAGLGAGAALGLAKLADALARPWPAVVVALASLLSMSTHVSMVEEVDCSLGAGSADAPSLNKPLCSDAYA